jgi:hypothetical protein
MNAPASNSEQLPTKRRRFRFRTSSLLWLVVVATAFFVGRQSDEIGRRLANAWHTIWPSSAPYRLVHQRDGSVLFIARSPIPRVSVDFPDVSSVTPLAPSEVQITAKRDGYQQVTFWHQDGTTTELRLMIRRGKFSPATRADEDSWRQRQSHSAVY